MVGCSSVCGVMDRSRGCVDRSRGCVVLCHPAHLHGGGEGGELGVLHVAVLRKPVHHLLRCTHSLRCVALHSSCQLTK